MHKINYTHFKFAILISLYVIKNLRKATAPQWILASLYIKGGKVSVVVGMASSVVHDVTMRMMS